MNVYLSTAYLAPVQYYTKLMAAQCIRVEHCENYIKQSYRNRCLIAGPDGVLPLTIPVEKTDNPKCPVRDIRISDHGQWRHLHWNALVSAYNHTPFFEYYKDDLQPFYEKKYAFLVDFNEELCRLMCGLIGLEPVMEATTTYASDVPQGWTDCRDSIHPKRPYTEDADFSPKPYYQVFDRKLGFLPNLSIIDPPGAATIHTYEPLNR